jgi:hypothetical protein
VPEKILKLRRSAAKIQRKKREVKKGRIAVAENDDGSEV